ncbi:MAG: tol-pal system-associated acyl-CoA thioesterase [Methylococcales bacterium]
MQNKNFSWPIRVYYEDTDAGGVVYHANYLKYFERARTEQLRGYGFELDVITQQAGIIFAIRSIKVDYIKPALFNELLEVTVVIDCLRPASILFEQQLVRPSGKVLCEANVRVACLGANDLKPCLIPDFIAQRIKDDA